MDLYSPLHLLERARSSIDFAALERAIWPHRERFPPSLDVDPQTGFFPSRPLPSLPEDFSIWEDAVVEAQEVLCLSEMTNAEAMAKRPQGERWRADLASCFSGLCWTLVACEVIFVIYCDSPLSCYSSRSGLPGARHSSCHDIR